MQPPGKTDFAVQSLLGDYPGHTGHDELFRPEGQPRSQWQTLLEDFSVLGAEMLLFTARPDTQEQLQVYTRLRCCALCSVL